MGSYGLNILRFLCLQTLVVSALTVTETIPSQSCITRHTTFKSNKALASTASDTTQTPSSFSHAIISTSSAQSIPTPQYLLDGQISLRLATKDDIPCIQEVALCHENYPVNHYNNLLSRWPDLALVAEFVPSTCKKLSKIGKRSIISSSFSDPEDDQHKSEIVGYILGKVVRGKKYLSLPPVSSQNDSSSNDREGSVSTTVSPTFHRGHITSIGIMPAFRRRGLAALLMDQLQLHLKYGYQTSHVGLNVRLDNTAAKNLYSERFGYEASSIIKRYYADDADALFMLKKLNTAEDNETVAIRNPGLMDVDDRQILNRWVKLVKNNLILFCDEKINRTGRKRGSLTNPIWENGPMTYRLPRDVAHCGKGH